LGAKEEILRGLREALASLDVDKVPTLCGEALRAGVPAYEVVVEGLAEGLKEIGERYEKGELFLSDLILSGEAVKEGMKVLEPHLSAGEPGRAMGKVVIGTVQGDLHDIGKNLVATLLKASGFEVNDLGIDVSPGEFVEEVKRSGAKILAMSALLTTTMVNMEAAVEELKRAGLRDSVKVIVGGAPVDADFAARIGADAAAKDALEGIRICRQWAQSPLQP
jgi:corrinoid protein of di/trimethylamine methyltransferase